MANRNPTLNAGSGATVMWIDAIGAICRKLEPHGRGRLGGWLNKRDRVVRYTDALGFTRRGSLSDIVEARWFLGVPPIDTRLIEDYVTEGSWALDIGAHTGIVTEALLRGVGPNGRVWAVEPIPSNAASLRQLQRENDLANLTLFECAASDSSGEAIIRTMGGPNSPYGSFTASWVKGEEYSVKTETLDNLVAADQGRVGFIKIDVEGAEPQVLEGATRVLTEHRPVVVCEFNDPVLQDAGSSSIELLQRFEALQYVVAPAFRPQSLDELSGIVRDLLLTPNQIAPTYRANDLSAH